MLNRFLLTRPTIAKIEAGGGNPTMGTIEALAGIFHLLPSELVRMAEVSRCEKAVGTYIRQRGSQGGTSVCPISSFFTFVPGRVRR